MDITNTFLVSLLVNADRNKKRERLGVKRIFGEVRRSDCFILPNGRLILNSKSILAS